MVVKCIWFKPHKRLMKLVFIIKNIKILINIYKKKKSMFQINFYSKKILSNYF